MSDVPSTGVALTTIARLTLMRLSRGKVIWVALAISFLPVMFAAGTPNKESILEAAFGIEMLVLAVVPALLIAPSIGEEIEDRTATYLWSRPLPRWTVLAGKLVALAPFSVALAAVSWVVAIELGLHVIPSTGSIVGVAVGALAVSCVCTGIATLVPKHGMALAIIYVLFFDLPIGQIPASVKLISVTHAATSMAGQNADSPTTAAIAAVAIAAIWIAVAFRRIRVIEA